MTFSPARLTRWDLDSVSRCRTGSTTMRSKCADMRIGSLVRLRTAAATAWVDAEHSLTQADLVKVDGPPARRLVRAGEPWATCRDGVVTALVTGGSAVVVVGTDADQVARIADSERATT